MLKVWVFIKETETEKCDECPRPAAVVAAAVVRRWCKRQCWRCRSVASTRFYLTYKTQRLCRFRSGIPLLRLLGSACSWLPRWSCQGVSRCQVQHSQCTFCIRVLFLCTCCMVVMQNEELWLRMWLFFLFWAEKKEAKNLVWIWRVLSNSLFRKKTV